MNTESIRLDEEQKARLREMCKKLFPEYSTCQVLITESNTVVIREVGRDQQFETKLVMHWFEFVMTKLALVIFNKIVSRDSHISPVFVDIKLGYLLRDTILIGIHPIDYLYQEFKLVK